jgi:hypothetical protein
MMMLIEDIETILTSTDPQHRSCDAILYDKTKRIKDYTTINLFGKLTDRNKIFLNARNNQDIRQRNGTVRSNCGNRTNVRNRQRLTITNHHPFITRVSSRIIQVVRITCHMRGCTKVGKPLRVIQFLNGAGRKSFSKVSRLLLLEFQEAPATFGQVSLFVTQLTVNREGG